MNKKNTLKKKIMRSTFLYETKKATFNAFWKAASLSILFLLFLIFGGLLVDTYFENELGDVVGNIINSGEYSLSYIKQAYLILSSEVPIWVAGVCIGAFFIGCILVLSVIKNWAVVSKKTKLLARYWFKI